jgi:hypothetical protein
VEVNSYKSLENVAKSIELYGCNRFTTGAVELRRLNNPVVHTRKAPETNRSEAGRTERAALLACSGSRSNSYRPLRVQHTATWSSMATATRRQNIATFHFSLFTNPQRYLSCTSASTLHGQPSHTSVLHVWLHSKPFN